MRTLKSHFENYISECQYVKRHRPATLKTSGDAFRHLLKLLPEIEDLEDLTPEMVTLFCKRLQTRERIIGKGRRIVGVRDSTVLSYVNRLKTFFKWLVDRRHIQSNPFDTIIPPVPSFKDHRALSGEEIRRIMGAIVQTSQHSFLQKRDLAMIAVLTFCGVRRTELLGLEVRDIDFIKGFITVRAETSKSRKVRDIPMNPHLKFHLKEYLIERKKKGCKSEFFFVSFTEDKVLTLDGLHHWVRRLVVASGVKFHVHRFRHTFATNLGLLDVHLVKIQRLMGHSDIRMTEKYMRSITTSKLKNDVDKLSYENLA